MLNRRRRHQTPTFLEGTPGLYVRRESPPRVPSTAPIPTKGDVTPRSGSHNGGGGSQSNASRSLSSSRSSLLQSSNHHSTAKKRTLMGASTPALVASALYASAASIATTAGGMGGGGAPNPLGSASPFNNFSSMQNFSAANASQLYQHQPQMPQHLARSHQQFHYQHDAAGRRLSHTPMRANRHGGGASRHELSSHSFNNPPSSSWAAARNNFGGGAKPAGINYSAMALSDDTSTSGAPSATRKNSSADASEIGSVKFNNNMRRRNLATSLSFGNVVESFRVDGDCGESSALPSEFSATQRAAISGAVAASGAMPSAQVGNFGKFSSSPRQKSSVSSGSGIVIICAPSRATTTKGGRGASSASLQSLPGSSILHDQSAISASVLLPTSTTAAAMGVGSPSRSATSSASAVALVNDPEADLPLPANWEVEVTPDGIRYYVDHDHRRTHWIHPLAVENLSPGWIKIFDHVHGVVYYNEVEKRSQFEHPGLATPAVQFASPHHHLHHPHLVHQPQILEEYPPTNAAALLPLPQQSSQTPNFVVEDLNIIDDKDVPEWIRLYSEAPFESDHLLNWEMFDLSQLEEFDQMLMKLFKQDAINTVIKYERPRREINDELAARNVVVS